MGPNGTTDDLCIQHTHNTHNTEYIHDVRTYVQDMNRGTVCLVQYDTYVGYFVADDDENCSVLIDSTVVHAMSDEIPLC